MAGAGGQHDDVAGTDVDLFALGAAERTRARPRATPSTSWIIE